jgi:hypothetical protein
MAKGSGTLLDIVGGNILRPDILKPGFPPPDFGTKVWVPPTPPKPEPNEPKRPPPPPKK